MTASDASSTPEGAPEGSAPPERKEGAKRAGRGFIVITGAKIYFILTAFGIQIALPRIFSPVVYGQYGTLMSAVSILDNILIASTIQSVSKLVSADEERAGAILRQGLKIQLAVGVVLAGTLFLAAPSFAALHQVPALGPMMRVASAVVLSYALYATLVGSLNGRQLFVTQAKLDISFSTLRTVGIVGGAVLGFGAIGAVGGFAIAAVGILAIALLVVGTGERAEGMHLRTWVGFMVPIAIYQGCLNLMLQVDLQVLSAVTTRMASDAGMSAQAASDHAQSLAGYYRAAQTFAFVPYQLILSMTFIVFPMVSKAMATGDEEEARTTIRGALRFSALALLAIACPIAGASDGVMRIAYPEQYLAGAPALGVLAMGVAAFALFVIVATILTSAGQPRVAASIAAVSVAVLLGATYFLIRRAGHDTGALVAAAGGTSAAMLFALLASAAALFARFKTFLPPLTVVRGSVAGATAYVVASAIPHGGRVMSVVALAGGFFAFLLALAITRELGGDEIRAGRRALGI